MTRRAVIYAFRSPGSGAVYIGKHQCCPEGWPRRGTGPLPDGYRGSGVAVANFHRRHGAAVQWRILAIVPLADWPRAERRAIRLARALLGNRCVNRLDGGDGLTSADSRALWARPGVREKQAASAEATNSRPEVRARRSAASKEALNRPEARERNSQQKREAWADPDYAARVKAANHAPAVKAARNASLVEARKRPEFKEALSAAVKEAWKDPGYRAKQCANNKQRWDVPTYRAKTTTGLKAAWADPEVKARRIASLNTPEAKAKKQATKLRNWVRAANARNNVRRKAAMEAAE